MLHTTNTTVLSLLGVAVSADTCGPLCFPAYQSTNQLNSQPQHSFP